MIKTYSISIFNFIGNQHKAEMTYIVLVTPYPIIVLSYLILKHLTLSVSVTLPGLTPISFTYDSTSMLYNIQHLDMNISVILTKLDTITTTDEEHIESVIVITVLKNVTMNGTNLECSIANLDIKSTILFVNTSGKY